MALTRDVMADRLVKVLQIVNTQVDLIAQLESEAQELKSNMIVKQERIIGLQEELIAAKDVQLCEMKDSVILLVGDTVQLQLKSYKEVLQENASAENCSLLNADVIKSAVKDVVAEDDRSRNVMIFGMTEDPEEQIAEKVGQVLEDIGEKPKFEATRIGIKTNQQSPRPVKVSV